MSRTPGPDPTQIVYYDEIRHGKSCKKLKLKELGYSCKEIESRMEKLKKNLLIFFSLFFFLIFQLMQNQFQIKKMNNSVYQKIYQKVHFGCVWQVSKRTKGLDHQIQIVSKKMVIPLEMVN